MILKRIAGERGRAQLDWLDSRHSFSFADYYDPAHMGFGPLRVINEDRIQPGRGFGTHGHRDMEIISYVIDGELEHRDSIGTGSVIRAGDVQRMSAGTGIRHSEYNPSGERANHFLQIWILPESRGIAPSYEQKTFGREAGDSLRLVLSRDGRDGSVRLHQNVDLYAGHLAKSAGVRHKFAPGRIGWIQVARGGIALNGERLSAGDGAAITEEHQITIRADDGGEAESAEILLFDMAG